MVQDSEVERLGTLALIVGATWFRVHGRARYIGRWRDLIRDDVRGELAMESSEMYAIIQSYHYTIIPLYYPTFILVYYTLILLYHCTVVVLYTETIMRVYYHTAILSCYYTIVVLRTQCKAWVCWMMSAILKCSTAPPLSRLAL